MENKESSMQERFDKEFPTYYDDQGLYLGKPTVNGKRWKFVDGKRDFPTEVKSFIQSEIDRAVAKREKEIVEWLRNRCQINMNIYGTTKWNKDMEGLISLITKQ